MRYGGTLSPPAIPDRIIGDRSQDGCASCRWGRQRAVRREEILGTTHDDAYGAPLDMLSQLNEGESSHRDRKPSPSWMCTLHNGWIEEMFDHMPELDRIVEGGEYEGRVNLRAGFGSEPTFAQKIVLPEWEDVTQMLLDRDGNAILDGNGAPRFVKRRVRKVVFHDRAGWSQEEWRDIHELRRQIVESKACLFHRTETERFKDRIPFGWMPKTESGVKVGAGLSVWCKDLPRELIRLYDHGEPLSKPEPRAIAPEETNPMSLEWGT